MAIQVYPYIMIVLYTYNVYSIIEHQFELCTIFHLWYGQIQWISYQELSLRLNFKGKPAALIEYGRESALIKKCA